MLYQKTKRRIITIPIFCNIWDVYYLCCFPLFFIIYVIIGKNDENTKNDRGDDNLIKVYDEKEKLIGFIDGKEYLDKKQNRIGWFDVDQDVVKDKDGYILLSIDKNGTIRYNDEQEVGYLKDEKIYFYDDSIIFELKRDDGNILRYNGDVVLSLKGDLSKIDGVDFFGICAIYLELFS
ncbi:MAG: hypothetical protein GF329_15860 [Candidatus Lokiarchaeota archaeon]|nr:hypothetical protein [Candidatus Lokiarchaeota archaeon]